MKNKIDRIKQHAEPINKRLISVVLVLIMVISCVSIGIVNVNAWSDYTWAKVHSNFGTYPGGYYGSYNDWQYHDLSNWDNGYAYDSFILGASSSYEFIYQIGGSNWSVFCSAKSAYTFDTSYGTDNYDSLNQDEKHFTLPTMTSASGFYRCTFSFNPSTNKSSITRTEIPAFTASYDSDEATISTIESISVYPSISGGTGNNSVSYSVTKDGASVTAGDYISDNTFTSSSPGVYVVTATATENTLTVLGTKTATMTITVTDPVYYLAYATARETVDFDQSGVATFAEMTSTGVTNEYEYDVTLSQATWHTFSITTGSSYSTHNAGRVFTSSAPAIKYIKTDGTEVDIEATTSYTTTSISDGLVTNIISDQRNDGSTAYYGFKITTSVANVSCNIKYNSSTNLVTISAGEPTGVTFYAKDGVMRNAEYWSFAKYADTDVAEDENVNITSTEEQYTDANYIIGSATKGQPITVTTTIDDDHKGDYYVAGFSFNGITPQLLSENDEGVYTCTYTIPEDFDGYVLEITPIIFLKAKHKDYYTMFNIAGYDNIKDSGWGNTLYIFPYYGEDNSGLIANYGTYPGQPVINYGGQLYTQIPSYDGITSGNEVAGLTINNGYWDFVHRAVEGWAESNDNHHQTYDYDDFYKIYKEYGNELNSVWFTFKYETAEQHRVNVPDNESGSNDTYYYKDDIASTLTQAQLDAYGTANGFEDYINPNGKKIDLFGEVLTGAELSADPIYVISQGYEYNNAGKFGTEWDVFVYNSTTGVYDKIIAENRTSIIPSALHVSSEKLSEYGLDDYSDLYTALQSYKDRPVMVSYEKDISGGYYSGGNNIAYRCDGVWSYTLKTDYISATTSIEYSDDNGATWTEDSYSDSSAVGSVTNCKAYFTYVDSDTNGYASSYNGATSISNALIDESKYFTFQAEAAGQYVFAGWIRRDAAGNESDIGYDSEYVGSSKMSSSAQFVARFKKVTSGNLAISHTLDSGSTGLGTTYLGVYVGTYADSTFTPEVIIANESTNTSAKTISGTYIKSSSEKYIEVVIKTVASGENTFNKFQLSIDGEDNIDSDETYLPSGESSTSESTTTQTIIFPISSLFTGSTQNHTSLAYYSLLNETLHKYEVTFIYQDRNGTSKSMLRKGTFTSNQLKNYVEGTGTSKTVATGFYNELVPSVSNFKSDITWDLSGASESGSWTSSNVDEATVYTFTATVESSLTTTLTRTVTFVTPFAMTKYVADNNTYVSSPYTQDVLSVTYGTLVKVNDGVYDVSNGNFVTAPSTLTDDDTTYYFHRWHITTTDGAEVASCYYPEYNYITYDNYIITAEYSTDTTKYYEYYKTESSVTATFLKNTRTQWNTGASTTPTEADLIYSDFALSYKYKDVELATADLTNGYNAGVIMQRLDTVGLDSDGHHSMTAAQYASQYGSTYSGLGSDVRGYLEDYAKTGSASGSGMTLRRTQFTNGHFDNKNRLEYYVGMYNSKSWNETNQKWDYTEWDSTTENWTESSYTNSKYVYRLFSYVYDVEADTVIISDPSYFFLYDTVNS